MLRLVYAACVLFLFMWCRADAEDAINSASLYDESHALLIGVSDYTNGWPKLKGVPDDIKAVNAALQSIGFKTEIVMDPDRAGIDRAITSFIARNGERPNNRLLFYFAGHGHTLTASYGGEMGYIVPRDAPDPNVDRAGFMSSAISMQAIEIYARQIEAKHALFVFDSCFSGSVFHPTRAIPEVVQEKSLRPVRQFITSGAADQPVPDYSQFRREFVNAITGQAGVGKDGFLTGSQLGMYLEDKVTGYSQRAQTPQYGKLQDPNLDRGDFIFILPPGSTVTITTPRAKGATKPSPSLSFVTPPSPSGEADETIFWQSIAQSTDAADFEDFLKRYPRSKFASIAKRRVAALHAKPNPTPAPIAAGTTPPPIRRVVSFTVPEYPKHGMTDLWSNTTGDAWVERPTEGPVNNFRAIERISVDDCPGSRLISDRAEGHVEAFVPDLGCSNMTLRLKVYVAGGNPYWSSFGGAMQGVVTARSR